MMLFCHLLSKSAQFLADLVLAPALFCTKAILSAFSCLILAFEKASPSYAVSVVYTLIACYCVLFFNDDPFMSLSLPMTMTFFG